MRSSSISNALFQTWANEKKLKFSIVFIVLFRVFTVKIAVNAVASGNKIGIVFLLIIIIKFYPINLK
jgi:hypothetical protein